MSKKLNEKLHNLAASTFNASSIIELALSKLEDSTCKCADNDVFSALMAVKEYLHDSVSIPLAELAESKEVEAV